MLPVIVISLAMMVTGAALWVGQAYRLLRFARGQLEEAWAELKTSLEGRREMVPYIVAVIPINTSPDLDVLGNACDLTANVSGVRECSQAEARLSAAINRLLLQLDAEATPETLDVLRPLRDRLKDQEMKIGIMRELYNRQVEVFNTLQKQAAARVLVSGGVISPVELF